MSDEVVIGVEDLGKRYRLGTYSNERYIALRDVLTERAKKLFRRDGRTEQGDAMREEFWALKDVSFEIKQGEVVGIIGRNGAGKSTLLKVLSRITDPTEGRVRIKGRVASLLEVGTGFHPELTGRENIFLNGAILGMTRSEIRKKFDEIVAFAETERFLDTPVKRYSSGMYVRLAFAVAAHLEPEILVIDEVLAVGDAAFQKKCLGKMQDVAHGGRTVLFVSHNMGAVNDLCSRCFLLECGQIVAEGGTESVTRKYLTHAAAPIDKITFAPASKEAFFEELGLYDDEEILQTSFDVRKPISILMRFTLKQSNPGLHVSFAVFNERGDRIFYHSNSYADQSALVEEVGTHEVVAKIPGNFLIPGSYSINVALHRPNVQIFDLREHVLCFDVEDTGSGRYDFAGVDLGCVLADVKWERRPPIK
jgi:homopolymeric O-antigen transport system ATP-binding protein